MGWQFYLGSPGVLVGYWPITLFTNMQDNAEQIRWGGQVLTPSSDQVSPPMGNGFYLGGQWNSTCYMRQLKAGNDTSYLLIPDDSFIEVVNSKCYFAGDNSYVDDEYWHYRFLFGGEGSKNC